MVTTEDNQMKDENEVLLKIGTEGGTLTIDRFRSLEGSWKFVLSTDESAMADFLDDEDQMELFHKYPPVDTFEEALELMDKYPWHKMHLMKIQDEYAEIIQSKKQKRLASEINNFIDTDGRLTRGVAEFIANELNKRGFDVYYDHGGKGEYKGKIVSSLRKKYNRDDELAQLDIAIVNQVTGQVVALVEIEETTNKLKTLLGDVFGTLMGNFVSLPGKPKSSVGNHTTLIIMGQGRNYEARNKYLRAKAMKAKSALGTGNSDIGNIVIGAFTDDEELRTLLMKQINKAVRRINDRAITRE